MIVKNVRRLPSSAISKMLSGTIPSMPTAHDGLKKWLNMPEIGHSSSTKWTLLAFCTKSLLPDDGVNKTTYRCVIVRPIVEVL